ncbi:polysaccharide deacetylase [Chromatiales bacterium (ex Bugula neritina AB1)]|nr:polysaccharide deacetylase [Chromatiales bacterium (ex Bugula neritina AB1)]
MHYDYVPLPKRQPLKWPNGARLALIVTINLEYWDLLKDSDKPYYAGGPPVIPDPMPGNVPDFPNYSWREYGHRVGVWRMIDTFDQAGVSASCTMNAKMGLERRDIIDAVNERGWELVAHNYEQGDLLTNYHFDREAEAKLIREALSVYKDVVGRASRGWLSSSLRSTTQTADILVEEGLSFICDYMNDEQPYLIKTPKGPIVSTPYSVEINDFTFFHRRGMGTSAVLELLKEQFDQLYLEGAASGRLMNIGLHPHVAGHPYRIRALREFLEYAKGFDDIWWATREDIADWYMENHQSHIPETP